MGRYLAAGFLGLAAVCGCSGLARPTSDPNYSEKQARETLVAALDAWQAGDARALARQSPPIRLVDDDLAAGTSLVSYEIDPAATFGPHRDVGVNLVLRDRHGGTASKQATYQVILADERAVLRNDP